MTDRGLARLAWIIFAFVTSLFVAGLIFAILNRSVEVPSDFGSSSSPLAGQLLYLAIFSFPLVGVLVASRQPRNAIGWILLAIGFFWGSGSFSEGYTVYGALTAPGSLPISSALVAFGAGGWIPPILLMGCYLVVLFPNGHLPTRRWRWLPWFAGIGGLLAFLAIDLFPGSLVDQGFPALQNPLGVEFLKPVLNVMFLTILTVPISLIASAIALVRRFRRARGLESMQLKWLALAAGLVAVTYLIVMVSSLPAWLLGTESEPGWTLFLQEVSIFAFALLPIAAGIAILKYRLYDIDLVINKTIVFGALAIFITAVYVSIVVGLGAALGSSGNPNIGLSIAATAIVAIAFSPVKDRVQRLANRLVYGHRLSPYEVLAELAKTIAAAESPEAVLQAIAASAASGTNAEEASVVLDLEDGSQVTAHSEEPATQSGSAGEIFSIVHRGEPLGALEIRKRAGDPLTPQDRKLCEDMVSQAGLGLHNARLLLELQVQLDEISTQADDLESSRVRIVSARDDSRRRLEHDISSGPRKGLECIASHLEHLSKVLDSDPEAAATRLGEMNEQATATLDQLRELARGIYPPLLADKGVVAALEAHVRKQELSVEIHADGMSEARFDERVEACLYFCAVDMFNSVTTPARFELTTAGGNLRFRLMPPGDTDIRPLQDRVESLDGALTVDEEDAGLIGEIPTRVLEEVRGS